MGSIFDVMADFFRQEGWHVSALEGQPILAHHYQGDNGEWSCFAIAQEEQHLFLYYSVYTGRIPVDRRPQMAEFITRANWGLDIGNFELDYRSGELRYKTSLDVDNSQLSVALVRNLVYHNVFLMDRYLPGIAAVANDGAEPAAVLARLEEASTS